MAPPPSPFESVQAGKPGIRLIVVLDNFSSHHAVLVNAYAAKNNIQLVYLPPYSPDLIPIEQIWRAI